MPGVTMDANYSGGFPPPDDGEGDETFPPWSAAERERRHQARVRGLERALTGSSYDLIRREKTLLGLVFDPETRRWVGEAYNLFRPKGLLITDAPAGAMLLEWMQGCDRVFPLGPGGVPLDLFVIMELRPETRPSYPTLELGSRISLTVIDAVDRSTIGPPMTLTVWGWTAR